MMLGPEDLERGRERLKQLFTFLQALHELKNPVVTRLEDQVWHLFLNELAPHSAIARGRIADNPGLNSQDSEEVDDFILRVRRPKLSPCPEPPPSLEPWLRPGWNKHEASPAIFDVRPAVDDAQRDEAFAENPERPRLFREWQLKRDFWKKSEAPAYAADRLFEKLYELHSRLERESERLELVIGDGIIRWSRGHAELHHPLLLRKVNLRFDPQIPEFVVEDTEHSLEFYGALFRSISDVDGTMLRKCHEETDAALIHPLGATTTSDYLRRIAGFISHRSVFSEEPPPRKTQEYPQLGRNPVIFMRVRNMGFPFVIQRILEDLKSRKDLPISLTTIAGIDPSKKETAPATIDSLMNANEDISVLFSKPANQQQLQIAQRLNQHGCVLVQGPPGTGKSHTIGNLIGHLLAQGKSILVTSHTTKALRVLRSHIVEGLRPLCMSVLDNDSRGQDDLKNSVESIAERLSSDDADSLDKQAEDLQRQRLELLRKTRVLRQQLLTARTDEYRDVVFNGVGVSPSVAARKVAEGIGKHDWIPKPIDSTAPPPLTDIEVIELYATNAIITLHDEDELTSKLPEMELLTLPDAFEAMAKEVTKLKESELRLRSDLWKDNISTSRTAVREVLKKAEDSVAELDTQKSWQLRLIDLGRRLGAHREPWDEIVLSARQLYEEFAKSQRVIFEHGPELNSEIEMYEQEQILGSIVEYTKAGKRIGWFTLLTKSKWKVLITASKVSGRAPFECEHFVSLLTLASINNKRTRFVERWKRMMLSIGAVELCEFGEQPEETCLKYAQIIEKHLNWSARVWSPVLQAFESIGFQWSLLERELQTQDAALSECIRAKKLIEEKLPDIFQSRIDLISWSLHSSTIQKLQRAIDGCFIGERTAKVVLALSKAVKALDHTSYAAAHQRLSELLHRRDTMSKRNELLKRLDVSAPAWAAQIRLRNTPHDATKPPGDSLEAWTWRQLNDELERRRQVKLEEILCELDELSAVTQSTTVKLIDRLTWAAQVRRTTLAQRQALIGYANIKKRIGKGTGKRENVLRNQAEARRLLGECRVAVPVWIMPITRVVESFLPNRDTFDVIVIDEASQSDVMALVALYFAKEVVIVGDHEQVSPDAVGQRQDEVNSLIDAHLTGIPNAKQYDGTTSIYDLARSAFGGLICLREHFRCVPDIIEFSNRLSYEGKILPLRDDSNVEIKPHVISHRVTNAERTGDVNRQEAITIASLIAAAIEQREYAEKTFGVVTLLGEDQAIEIDQLLRQYLNPIEYEQRRIICGNPSQFQGDERDVMLLSMVDVPGDGPLTMKTYGPREMYKQRYNVAASRAKDQLWVVYSLDPHVDLKPDDLRRRLIEFSLDPKKHVELDEEASELTESEFEKQVYIHLKEKGYSITPQYPVGAYRIDLVVSNPANKKKIAIECDGDRFHPIEKLPEDMARQGILERLGWRFIRIRGSEYFCNPDAVMLRVESRLKSLGIEPCGHKDTVSNSCDTELIERVKVRAAAIRQTWALPEQTNSSSHRDLESGTERLISENHNASIPARSEPNKNIRQPDNVLIDNFKSFSSTESTARNEPISGKAALRSALEQQVQEHFKPCKRCEIRLKLYISKRGPYLECPSCDTRIPVPALIVQEALKSISARCPECKSEMTASDAGDGVILRCIDRGHHVRNPELLVI